MMQLWPYHAHTSLETPSYPLISIRWNIHKSFQKEGKQRGLWKTKLNLLAHFFLYSPFIHFKLQTSHLHCSAEITQVNYHLHFPPSGSDNLNTLLSAELQNLTWTRVNENLMVGMIRQEGKGRTEGLRSPTAMLPNITCAPHRASPPPAL